MMFKIKERWYSTQDLTYVACRGREQIRTAVQGFADLCLTARPRDHLRVQT